MAPVPLLAAQLFDFHEGKGVDHGSQDLSGDPRVEPAFRGDVVDSREHLVLPPAVHDAHSLRLLERDDLADERAALDEKLPETRVEIVESTANIGQSVFRPVRRCHASILTPTPVTMIGRRHATGVNGIFVPLVLD